MRLARIVSVVFCSLSILSLANYSYAQTRTSSDPCIEMIHNAMYNYYSGIGIKAHESNFQQQYCNAYNALRNGDLKVDAAAHVAVKGLFNADAKVTRQELLTYGQLICTDTRSRLFSNEDISSLSKVLSIEALRTVGDICNNKPSLSAEVDVDDQRNIVSITVKTKSMEHPLRGPINPVFDSVKFAHLSKCSGSLKLKHEVRGTQTYSCVRDVYSKPQRDLLSGEMIIKPAAELQIDLGQPYHVYVKAVPVRLVEKPDFKKQNETLYAYELTYGTFRWCVSKYYSEAVAESWESIVRESYGYLVGNVKSAKLLPSIECSSATTDIGAVLISYLRKNVASILAMRQSHIRFSESLAIEMISLLGYFPNSARENKGILNNLLLKLSSNGSEIATSKERIRNIMRELMMPDSYINDIERTSDQSSLIDLMNKIRQYFISQSDVKSSLHQ